MSNTFPVDGPSPEHSAPLTLERAIALEADLFAEGFRHAKDFIPGSSLFNVNIIPYENGMVEVDTPTLDDYVAAERAYMGTQNVVIIPGFKREGTMLSRTRPDGVTSYYAEDVKLVPSPTTTAIYIRHVETDIEACRPSFKSLIEECLSDGSATYFEWPEDLKEVVAMIAGQEIQRPTLPQKFARFLLRR
ncbi:hypothetical protein BH23PAT1_BH23PAT1_4080 [soil metagenome]